MSVENGEWVMYGVEEDDPNCLHTVKEAAAYIRRVGFLPLFRNAVPGFSMEEHTAARHWWSEDPARDPWEWRGILAGTGDIAYGKFFSGKAGFVSGEWLPYFLNCRRDGYDFDALWDDGKAGIRQKKIMDCFTITTELLSPELKEKAGFGKSREKGFEGTITGLQMQGYLCVKDFRRRINKKGQPYGWAAAVYCMPEHIFGYKHVTSAYKEKPKESEKRIIAKIAGEFPGAEEKQLRKFLKL
ncbi:MAG: hypothetical protein HUJ73_08810 [Eubacterium sp.]|nr:hypothetical protein [Eubacterium sp.]